MAKQNFKKSVLILESLPIDDPILFKLDNSDRLVYCWSREIYWWLTINEHANLNKKFN